MIGGLWFYGIVPQGSFIALHHFPGIIRHRQGIKVQQCRRCIGGSCPPFSSFLSDWRRRSGTGRITVTVLGRTAKGAHLDHRGTVGATTPSRHVQRSMATLFYHCSRGVSCLSGRCFSFLFGSRRSPFATLPGWIWTKKGQHDTYDDDCQSRRIKSRRYRERSPTVVHNDPVVTNTNNNLRNCETREC